MTHQSIRPASPNDLPRIIEMIRGIAAFTNTLHQFEATEDNLKDSFFSEKPVAQALVATDEKGENVIGYAIYYRNFSSFLGRSGIYLEDLFIEEAYRGNGLGTGLFREVARIARLEDCSRMEWLALSWNKPALEFYEQLGAAEQEDYRLIRLDPNNVGTLGK